VSILPRRDAGTRAAAALADAAVVHFAAALLVDDRHRWAVALGGVPVAPGEQGHQGGPEVKPFSVRKYS
jgi:hypothetical protein